MLPLPVSATGHDRRDDPDYVDAIRIETALGIPVLRHDEKKPGGVAEVLAFFEGKGSEGENVSGRAIDVDCAVVVVLRRAVGCVRAREGERERERRLKVRGRVFKWVSAAGGVPFGLLLRFKTAGGVFHEKYLVVI